MLTVIILTKDEEKHIARAIRSVMPLAARVLVVDSGSTDKTVQIAKDLGAEVLYHRWKNYASQFNWALDQLPISSRWILRLDADEYLTPELVDQIKSALSSLPDDIEGLVMTRAMVFMDRIMKHGGLYPLEVLRVFRFGRARCEERWMDEHIKVQGPTKKLSGMIIEIGRAHV